MFPQTEKYQKIKALGSQVNRKFGTVFLVRNILTGELGILKSIKKETNNLHLQERIRKEAEFSFDFSELPKTIEIVENGDEIFIVKTYFPGITLDEYWAKIKARKRLIILKEIIEKLVPIFNELIVQQVVHCDLKSSNIIINETPDGMTVALIDFGLALHLNEENNRSTLFPLGYAAPELLLNRLDLVDQRTDLFALGIIIWRLFDGKLPLTHPNPSIFTNLQLTYPLPDSSELPKGIYPLLSKMCSKHTFRTSPNLLPKTEVTAALLDAMNNRYADLTAFNKEIQHVKSTKNWLGF
jgi:serine/threonine protein kinase